MSISEILNYSVYGLVAGLALLLALFGFIKGFGRQTIKFATFLGSFVISFVLFGKIFPLFFSLTKGKTLHGLVSSFGLTLPDKITTILASVSAEASSYVLAVPMALVILPLCFILSFIVISALLWIPGYVICGAMGFTKRANTLLTRMLGALLGAVEGIFVAAIILVPVAGMVGVASNTIAEVNERRPDSEKSASVPAFYESNIKPLESNPVLNFIDGKLGFVYDSLTTVKIDGEEVDMGQTAADFYEAYVIYGDMGKFDYTKLTDQNKAAIDGLIDLLTKNEYLSTISSGALNAIFTAVHHNQVVLNLQEPVSGFVGSILTVYETTDNSTVREDLLTTRNVYYIFSDHDSIAAIKKEGDLTANLLDALLIKDESGKSTVSLVCAEFKKNPRFAPISKNLSEFAMEILISNSGIPGEEAAEKIENVKENLNEIIKIDKDSYNTPEEYKGAVSESIDKTLADNGIALPPDKVDVLADKFIEDFGEREDEMTDIEFAEFMGNYYDLYAKGELGDITPPPGFEIE